MKKKVAVTVNGVARMRKLLLVMSVVSCVVVVPLVSTEWWHWVGFGVVGLTTAAAWFVRGFCYGVNTSFVAIAESFVLASESAAECPSEEVTLH